MNSAVSKKWVTLSFFGTILLIVADELANKQAGWVEPHRIFWAGVAFVSLGFVAEASPDLAGALALLIFLSFLLDSEAVRAFGTGRLSASSSVAGRGRRARPKARPRKKNAFAGKTAGGTVAA